MQNQDDNCFFKYIYEYFNRDKYRHDYRDIPMTIVDEFLSTNNIDKSIFANGITSEAFKFLKKLLR
jgi:hypothetical protein